MIVLKIIFYPLLIGFLLVVLNYILYLLKFKDNKYPIVQRSDKLEPEEETPEVFLPGSRMAIEGEEDIKKAMEEGLEITKLEVEKKKERHPVFGTKDDLKRAIILEDLLRKKWEKSQNTNDL